MQTNFTTSKATARSLMLAGFVTLALSNNGWAQVCCNGSTGWAGQPMMMEAADPAAELADFYDPMRTINLTIVVHEKASVVVNGEPTFTKGSVRQYIVRDVEPGKRYKFEINAAYINEFEALYTAKAMVTLAAGSSERVVLHVRRTKRQPPPVPVMPVVPVMPATPAQLQ